MTATQTKFARFALSFAAFVGLAALLPTAPTQAQTWPTRPIRIIVTQAAGGTPDIMCRLVMDRVSAALGQQIVVENRPGGGNVIGAQAAAHAARDGYTFLFATAAALASNPFTFKSLPYDPQTDFTPVGFIARNPFVVAVHPDVPAKTIGELIAYDKANPGRLSFATDGPRNFSGMLASWFNKAAGTNIQQVSYAAMPQGVQDTVAGRVQVVINAIPTVRSLIETGKLRPLAVSTAKRVPGFEQWPAVAETLPGFELVGWFAVVAPSGVPQEVIARMNREIDKAVKEPELQKRFAELGMYTDGADTPAGLAGYIKDQRGVWERLVREVGLAAE